MMPYAKNEELTAKIASCSSVSRGFSLVELMVTMVIFGILMTGIFQAYIAQMKNTAREYGIAESDIDRSVGQGIIGRDIYMAGYGLADDYNGTGFTPWAIQSTDGGTGASDNLTLMGTALGLNSQQAQHWSYVSEIDDTDNTKFTPREWQEWQDDTNTFSADPRENLSSNDMVILVESSTKRLFTDNAGGWLFKYVDGDNNLNTDSDNVLVTTEGVGSPWTPNTPWDAGPNLGSDPVAVGLIPNGAMIYGLHGSGVAAAEQPYYAVRYYLSVDPGDGCSPGVKNLLRIESRITETPSGSGAKSIIPCVADFQVAIGLDTNNDRDIDLWQNGGVTTAGGYDPARLNRSLRQVRVYALTQIGDRDRFYTYPSPTIQVGDPSLGAGVGRTYTLSDEQRKYRWRVIRFVAVPRNIR